MKPPINWDEWEEISSKEYRALDKNMFFYRYLDEYHYFKRKLKYQKVVYPIEITEFSKDNNNESSISELKKLGNVLCNFSFDKWNDILLIEVHKLERRFGNTPHTKVTDSIRSNSENYQDKTKAESLRGQEGKA